MDAADNTNFPAYLQTTSSDSAIPLLLKALHNETSDVRSQAARTLGKIGSPEAVTVLLKALNDEDSHVRGWAAWALAQIATPKVVTRLKDALNHQATHVRIWAVWALGQIATSKAVAGLLGALNHKDYEVRWRAASALGKVRSEAVVAQLLPALKDTDYYVRGRVAAALGKIGSEAAAPFLVRSLNDKEFYVRGVATQALRQIGTSAVVTELSPALNDKDADVRKRAAWIVKQIHTCRASSSDREDEREATFSLVADTRLMQESGDWDSSLHKEQPSPTSNKLPTILITSYAEASKCLLSATRGPLIKHLLSIGSSGEDPPQGYIQVPHRLRLEFDDIDVPDDDPEYVMATSRDILKVIDFVNLISLDSEHVLIHCQAGISRSSAVALTVWAMLLGASQEQKALALVLAARPQAVPNKWIVELADEALGRGGKLVEVVQHYHDSLFES